MCIKLHQRQLNTEERKVSITHYTRRLYSELQKYVYHYEAWRPSLYKKYQSTLYEVTHFLRYENKVNKNIMLWEIVKNVGKYVYENIIKTI